MNQTKTKERIEYEKALKHVHELSLKATLSDEGIHTSKVTKQKLDEIRRLLDKGNQVNQKFRNVINNAQQEADAIIKKAEEDRKAEIAGIEKETEEIINSIKIAQGLVAVEQPKPQETQEQAKEEKV